MKHDGKCLSCDKKSKKVLCDPCLITAQNRRIEYLLRERDSVDWMIRQIHNEKVITMKQMCQILHFWHQVILKNGNRLTVREIRKSTKRKTK